ncbi:hypothetical protein P7K49_032611 [Saguinus oedipus]|uniref:ZP domain-containing protein n=1 Tax=Saguinus oedipus TaxID=9490 RepID=A0ABQ9TYR1_SAGOE|nr:hypothetical protein P7K49_032611 [Saguinus oedipus]
MKRPGSGSPEGCLQGGWAVIRGNCGFSAASMVREVWGERCMWPRLLQHPQAYAGLLQGCGARWRACYRTAFLLLRAPRTPAFLLLRAPRIPSLRLQWRGSASQGWGSAASRKAYLCNCHEVRTGSGSAPSGQQGISRGRPLGSLRRFMVGRIARVSMLLNVTSTVVRTTLRNDLPPEGIIHYVKIVSPIYCVFQNDLLTSCGFTPEWGVYTVIEDLHGAGNFVTEMQLFIGDSPIPQNYSVSASEDVKIEVGLYRQKSSLKVVLMECWATPSSNARDPVTFSFISNSCPVPNTYTHVIENGNSSKARFKLRIFSFIHNSIVYLHCKLRICMDSPGATCKIIHAGIFLSNGTEGTSGPNGSRLKATHEEPAPGSIRASENCSNFRLLKSSDTSATHQMSWGPLIRSEGELMTGFSQLRKRCSQFLSTSVCTEKPLFEMWNS